MQNLQKEKARRGFAAMSAEKQKAIAQMGGKAAHEQGVAHKWTSEEAKDAGKKGGIMSGRRRSNRTENDGNDHIL